MRPKDRNSKSDSSSGKPKQDQPAQGRPIRTKRSNATDAIGRLRIIGGSLRSRVIEFSTDPRTRPMKDRTREAVFNLLGGKLNGYAAFDLFAGSGILAFEAISRGAEYAVAIEMLARPAKEIIANSKRLGVEDRCVAFAADTFRWVQHLDDHRTQFSHRFATPIDLRWCVFVCPPYQLWTTQTEELRALLVTWIEAAPAGSLFAIELDESTPLEILPKSIDWLVREYRPAMIAIGEKPSCVAS